MRDDLAALCAALADEYGHGPMDERQQIEGLVQWGRISPQDAEDWLKAQDSKKRESPMADEPDPSKFDPAAEPFWTLGMATAWVLWGTDDAVRSEWADFITRRWSWRPYDEMEAHEKAPGGKVRVKGHKLHQGEPKGAWGVVAFAGANPAGLRTTPEDAKRKILSALQREGDLPAVQGDDEHVREVPAMAWVGLSPFSPGRREQHDAVFARGSPRDPKLHRVRVRSVDVLRLWPVDSAEAQTKADDASAKPAQIVQTEKISDAELHAFLHGIEEHGLTRDAVFALQKQHFGKRARGQRDVFRAIAEGHYKHKLGRGKRPSK